MSAEKQLYNKESYIATESEIYKIGVLPPDWENTPYTELDDQTAYILNGYYYVKQGELSSEITKEPGLYSSKDGKIVLVEVITDEEKEKYDIKRHIVDVDVENLICILKGDNENYIDIPESSKLFNPDVNVNDDILKRAMKQALKNKNVDIDLQKDRFLNKNQLLNFKQIIKGDKNLSMLLFQRGVEVLGLKFTIIVEEVGNEVIGKPLEEPIIVCSEDTYGQEEGDK